jgi:hypothetical protein
VRGVHDDVRRGQLHLGGLHGLGRRRVHGLRLVQPRHADRARRVPGHGRERRGHVPVQGRLQPERQRRILGRDVHGVRKQNLLGRGRHELHSVVDELPGRHLLQDRRQFDRGRGLLAMRS